MLRAAVGAAPTVGLIGVRGYGAVHLAELDRLAGVGRARLVACADVVPPAGPQAAIIARLGSEYFGDWREMLGGPRRPAVVVIASPLHLHAEMCLEALRAGVHVLVEKPPVVTLHDFGSLTDAAAASGALCQVGFQSAGSLALDRLREVVARSELGRPLRLVATGLWQRDRAYWARSDWAGKEALGGLAVRDGAFSNPFAHAVMGCLLAGAGTGTDELGAVEVERFRANRIEVEDTGCLRVHLAKGLAFAVAVTLCAERAEPPALHLEGPLGAATWAYEHDTVSFSLGGRHWKEPFNRQSLLDELLGAVSGRPGGGRGRLSCPLERARLFVGLVEVVHAAPLHDVDAGHVRWEGEGEAARPVIAGVDGAIRRVKETSQLFSELGLPWAPARGQAARGPEQAP